FRGGGYENTPLARVLPVYLDRVGSAGFSGGWRWELTREGWLEPWLRLRDAELEEGDRLESMPDFLVHNRIRAIKPGASVLAQLRDAGGNSSPAVVAHRYGEGRAMVLLVGDLWRWGMRGPTHHADLDRAWRQTLRWLLADVPEAVELRVEQSHKGGGRLVDLEVRVRDESFFPEDDAIVSLVVTDAVGGRTELDAEPSLEVGGLFTARYSATAQGIHRVRTEVRDEAGASLGGAESGWALDMGPREFRKLEPDGNLMNELARISGGEVVNVGDLPALARSLPERGAPAMEMRSRPLWHSPWFLLAVLLFFGVEWVLRRKWVLA
ncbi:MAG: hypothetical protein ACC661_04475, partial [Verrucomicrobiales bacterium]